MTQRPHRPAIRWPATLTVGAALAVTLAAVLPPAGADQAVSMTTSGLEVSASHPGGPLKDMADVFLVEQDGGWFCPRDRPLEAVAVCPETTDEGRTSQAFAERLIEDVVAHPELAPPMFVRAGKARNDCSYAPGAGCTTGVPAQPSEPCLDPQLPPEEFIVGSPYCALQGLKDVGIRLGVVVGAAGDEINGVKEPRSVKELTYHACRINQADTTDLYDFMFLDLAFKLKNVDLKDVVAKIQGGTYWNKAAGAYEPCPYGSWPRLITNDTTYPHRTLETGAWGHAKSFAVLEGDDWRAKAEAAADGTQPAIRQEDLDFIRDVHQLDPGSHPVLRFEVPSQTDRFAQLDARDQCSLLRRWAKQQKQSPTATEHFSMISAFYVHGLPDKPETYDSLYRGTFLRQRELIHFYNPDLADRSLSACPQPAS